MPAEAVAREDSSWHSDLLSYAAQIGAGLWAGLISGALIGGVGGRLAMFVLRLTSDPSLAGVETDDGFIIGSFTGSTIFLVLLTTVAGMLGGLFYLCVREWLPQRGRPLVMGVFGGAVGGAIVINPGGIDFTRLEPLSLAIAMFIALPVIYGAAMSWTAEKLLLRRESRDRSRLSVVVGLLPLVAIAILGTVGLAIVLVAAALWAINRQAPLTQIWSSRAVTWLGRAALAGIIAYASVALVGDIVDIL